MNSINHPFVLERRHIEEGLTKEDIERYVGDDFTVRLARHDLFSGSDELRKTGALSEEKRLVRQREMENYFRPDDGGWQKWMADLAASPTGASLPNCAVISLASLKTDKGGGAWNPEKAQTRYWLAEDWNNNQPFNRWVVAPAMPGKTLGESYPSPGLVIEAMLLLEPINEAPENAWRCRTKLPAEKLTRLPDPKINTLCIDLHETQHFVQICDAEGDPPCHEFDADLMPSSVLRDQLPLLGIDPTEHLHINLMCRYASLMIAMPSHRIAPSLESFYEKGRPVAFRADTDGVVETIYAALRDKDANLSPDDTDDTFWKNIECARSFLCDPEYTYSLLRRCVNDGAFADDKPTEHAANRVLESIEFFSENLTRDPSVVNKIYPSAAPQP